MHRGALVTHFLRIRLLGMPACAMAFAVLLVAASPAWAQDPSRRAMSDFSRLPGQLKTGDGVVVSLQDGTTISGRVADISTMQIEVIVNDVRREIRAEQITRVQRRRNGIAIDAFMVVPRTVFDRTPSTRAQFSIVVGPGRAVAQLTMKR